MIVPLKSISASGCSTSKSTPTEHDSEANRQYMWHCLRYGSIPDPAALIPRSCSPMRRKPLGSVDMLDGITCLYC